MRNISKTELKSFLFLSVNAALEAGGAVMEIYQQKNIFVDYKDDNTPLTQADLRSNSIILKHLHSSELPIISEETNIAPYSVRKKWDYFWLIDPLDGTKEFVKRNGEFTINIALIYKQKAILGVIYLPAFKILYFSAKGYGSYKLVLNGSERILKEELLFKALKLPLNTSNDKLIVTLSRSHFQKENINYIEKINKNKPVDVIRKGSSLKFCMVAEGVADIYPRIGRTMEWDTGAGSAIAEESGAKVISMITHLPLIYNKENLANPDFIVYR